MRLDQLRLQLLERDVGRRGDLGEDEVGMRLDAMRFAIAALRGRSQAAGGLALAPADHARRADLEARRRLAPRQAALDVGDGTFAKIQRQRLAHACQPPSRQHAA